MEEALRFLGYYEIWVYALLGLGALLYVRKYLISWDELRGAAFGLERESARSKLNNAAIMITFFLGLGVAVFVLVSFVSPGIPGANPLMTPTINVLATQTETLSEEGATNQVQPGSTSIAASTPESTGNEGCIQEQVLITEPINGSEISGIITVKGTANIPNFGFYKYEIARPGETIWLTIQAGREIKVDSDLGQWDTRTLQSGDYMLRLVVTDNQGQALDPCIVQVRVNNPVTP